MFSIHCNARIKEIGKKSERISKIKPFINKYNWKDKFHQEKMTGKKSRKNTSNDSS